MNKIIILTLLLLVKKICSKELICSHNMCTDYQIETKNGTYLINQEKDGYTIIFNNKIEAKTFNDAISIKTIESFEKEIDKKNQQIKEIIIFQIENFYFKFRFKLVKFFNFEIH